MTERQTQNSQLIFDAIMKNIKPEEKLLYAGAASRLADSFAEEGFEIVPIAEWKQHGFEMQCSHCGAEAHIHPDTRKSLLTKRCHICGARMKNGTVEQKEG